MMICCSVGRERKAAGGELSGSAQSTRSISQVKRGFQGIIFGLVDFPCTYFVIWILNPDVRFLDEITQGPC